MNESRSDNIDPLSEKFEDQTSLLVSELTRHIATYRRRQIHNRRATRFHRISFVVLGAFTTILLGLKEYSLFKPHDDLISMIALGASAIVAALATWEGFAGYGQRWVRERVTIVALFEVRDDLNYAISRGTSIDQDVLDELFRRMKNALKMDSDGWNDQGAKAILGA